MYNLSKDYELLYKKICEGHEAFCLVNYDLRDGKEPLRDPAKVRRFGEYDIQVGARGIGYGDVRTFHKDRGTEQELFIKECQRMNLEWVLPPAEIKEFDFHTMKRMEGVIKKHGIDETIRLYPEHKQYINDAVSRGIEKTAVTPRPWMDGPTFKGTFVKK